MTDLTDMFDIGDCWTWLRGTSRGYGQVWDKQRGQNVPVHRWVYETLVGPVPVGLVADHLCRNRACANPDHIEFVAQRENVRRGAAMALRGTCSAGHLYTEPNTIVRKDGARRCRECARRYQRKYRERMEECHE